MAREALFNDINSPFHDQDMTNKLGRSGKNKQKSLLLSRSSSGVQQRQNSVNTNSFKSNATARSTQKRRATESHDVQMLDLKKKKKRIQLTEVDMKLKKGPE